MFDFLKNNPIAFTATIAAGTSIITFFITLFTKNFFESRLHRNKLETEHTYAQRKHIKEVLSKYKTHLLNSSELLNHRLLNLEKNYDKEWHYVEGDYPSLESYYFSSFIYRILRFLNWLKIIEKELIFLDTTIATKEDLYFIKYAKTFYQLLQDVSLFSGLEYDTNYQTDHVFRDNLDELTYAIQTGNKDVLNFTEFKNIEPEKSKNFVNLCMFIDGIKPKEDRLRWDRLLTFHLVLVCFMNSYGYDFQETSQEETSWIIDKIENKEILLNFKRIIHENKMEKEENVKKIIKIIDNIK
jgi:hypothetical protein